MLSPAALLLTVALRADAGEPTPPARSAAEVVDPTPPVSPTPPSSPQAPDAAPAVKWVSSGAPGGSTTSETKPTKPATPQAAPGPATVPPRVGRRRRAKLQPAAKVPEPGVSHASLVAPSLSPEAFRAELAHPASDDDGASRPAPDDRARLEKLGAEIAAARAALREDTARLETTLGRRPGAGSDPKGRSAEAEPHAAPGDKPSPAAAPGVPPAASTGRGQIEIVSKELAGIKPEQAAAILAHLDRVLAAEVLRRMKAADAGAAMARLAPEMAAELATEIATRLPPLEPPRDRP